MGVIGSVNKSTDSLPDHMYLSGKILGKSDHLNFNATSLFNNLTMFHDQRVHSMLSNAHHKSQYLYSLQQY